MASSSTSSDPKTFKYAVFLSFRGVDTRNNFVAHLHSALKRHCIHTFKDDKNMEKGERISTELIKAIEDSRFHIIVFSRNYASSSWCLDELVKIMECQKTTEQKAYPVFYDVEPTEVRKQIGAFGEAFAENEKKEDAGKWIRALKEAANLSGFSLKGDEAEFIDEIVGQISQELPSIKFSDVEKFIGMDGRVEDVVSSLKTGVNEVHMIGIWGMGGAGKTTLAKAVFDQISHQFKHKIFVENVREKVSKDSSGLESLQQLVLSAVLKDQKINVTSVSDGKLQMIKMMHNKEVLLVLDDVNHIKQLEALADRNWFMQGSIIIITTRDEGVLIAHEVKSIHGVNLLSDEEAIRLFSWHAFGIEIPIPDQYKELSRQVVRYAAGLPLTIRVLGLDFKGKDEDEWKDTLERLEKIPLEETLQRLELSYTSLEPESKDIFLDIACFWKGKDKDDAIRALECCQLHAKAGLRVLERKSLITVSEYGSLEMHDSIQEMGWDIVRRDHRDEPERCSRLWDAKEIENILANDLGSEATRGIKLWSWELNPSIIIQGLKNMKKLRVLHVFNGYDFCMDYNDGSHRDKKNGEVSQYFPNALQYLYWDGYPFSSLPITFQASNLVGLYMSHGNLVQLWEGGERKVLPKLRFLEIVDSRLKTLDLGLTPALDTLSITNCLHLVEVQMPTKCRNLKFLHIYGSKLTTLDLEGALNLETLRLDYCLHLVEVRMPAKCLNLKILCIIGSKLTTQTLDLEGALNLETLNLDGCLHLVEVQMPAKCRNLKLLDINGSKLTALDLEGALNLETLYLRDCSDLVELQMPAECLTLKSIDIRCSKLSTLDLGGVLNLETLYLRDCSDLVELQMPVECPKLKTLNASRSKLKTLKLRTPNLEILKLKKCSDLEVLHMPDKCPKLTYLSLRHSKLRTFNLMQTPSLSTLDLEGCYNLVKLDAPIGCLKRITTLNLSGCSRFENFDFFKKSSFRSLELNLIVKSIYICPLHPDDSNLPKFQFECYYDEGGPSLIGNLEKLISVGLCACTKLEAFYESICDLRDLRKLTLIGKIPEVPKDLGRLGSLEELKLSSTEIKHLPDSICMLQHLKFLILKSCIAVEKLPEELGSLKCLETLDIKDTHISHLPQSIVLLKDLRIIGSELLLQSCSFTSQIHTSYFETFYYRGTHSRSLLYRGDYLLTVYGASIEETVEKES